MGSVSALHLGVLTPEVLWIKGVHRETIGK
jgi:hypothetical protein